MPSRLSNYFNCGGLRPLSYRLTSRSVITIPAIEPPYVGTRPRVKPRIFPPTIQEPPDIPTTTVKPRPPSTTVPSVPVIPDEPVNQSTGTPTGAVGVSTGTPTGPTQTGTIGTFPGGVTQVTQTGVVNVVGAGITRPPKINTTNALFPRSNESTVVVTNQTTNTLGENTPVDTRGRTLNPKITEVPTRYRGVVNNGVKSCEPCLANEPCQYRSEAECIQSFLFGDPDLSFEVPSRGLTNNQKPRYLPQSQYTEISRNTYDAQSSEFFRRSLPNPPPNTSPRAENLRIVGDSVREVKPIKYDEQKNTMYFDDDKRIEIKINLDKLYDETYNFFDYPPTTQTKIVSNSIRLDIFKDRIPEEVSYFLKKNQNQQSNKWHEKIYFDLTLDKLALSINNTLLNSFKSIHDNQSTLVSLDDFLITLKNLLISNKLQEFNPSFYTDLSIKQKNDELISISQPATQTLKDRAVISLVENGAILADPGYYDGYNKFKLLRQKRLNTDINSRIEVTTLDNQDLDIFLEDAGISFSDIDATDNFVEIGVGDGYFIETTNIDDVQLSVPTPNESVKALLTPSTIRNLALRTAGEPDTISITVSSVSSNNELTDTFNMHEEGTLFFELVLSSVVITNESQTLLNKLKANYKLVTSESRINDLIINYGFNTTKINLDFRDPLLTYAKDSSSFVMEKSDITFRNFDFYISGTHDSSFILTRNIPFAIVLVPGCGSEHNPFDSQSEFINFNNNIISRNITLINTIKVKDNQELDTSLKEAPTERTDSPPPDYYGYADKLYYSYDPSSYTNTYYYDNTRYSNKPTQITSTRPIVAKIIKEIIQPLIIKYSPKELKWFDIFSRLTYSEMGEYVTRGDYTLITDLVKKLYNISIKDVIATDKDTITGIISTEESEDIEVTVREPIITAGDR